MTILREKTLNYRRAEWFGGTGRTLESYLKSAFRTLPDVSDRTILHGAQFVRSAKVRVMSDGGLLVHITAETPGEPTSAVPKVAPGSAELDLKEEAPPFDGEWLNGDAFLLVKDDHLCVCATEIRDGAVRYFLHELFKKAKLSKDATKFDLIKVADMATIRMLHQEGVKEIEIRATMYKAAANYERRKAHGVSAAAAAAKQALTFFKKPNDCTPDGLRVCLTFKTDERFPRSALAIGEKRIEDLAVDVVKNTKEKDPVTHDEDEFEYVIVTKTGLRITPKEISLRRKVKIESDGSTVKRDKAWGELKKFFGALHDSGQLEQ